MATHRTDYRGSLAVPSGACSCQGQPEKEVAGRPEALPLGWQVVGEPLEEQTDPVVVEEAHSRNLQIGQKDRHHPHPWPSHQELPWESTQDKLEPCTGPPKTMADTQTADRTARSCAGPGTACSGAG